jgi:hypothetical protein
LPKVARMPKVTETREPTPEEDWPLVIGYLERAVDAEASVGAGVALDVRNVFDAMHAPGVLKTQTRLSVASYLYTETTKDGIGARLSTVLRMVAKGLDRCAHREPPKAEKPKAEPKGKKAKALPEGSCPGSRQQVPEDRIAERPSCTVCGRQVGTTRKPAKPKPEDKQLSLFG